MMPVKIMKNYMLPIVFLLMLAGILMGIHYPDVFSCLKKSLPVALFMMLFKPFFYADVRSLKDGRGHKVRYLGLVTVFYLVVVPVMAFLLFEVFHQIYPEVPAAFLAGIVLISLAPLPSSAPAFTGLAGGDVELVTLGVVWTFLLSLGAVPLYSRLILHTLIHVSVMLLTKSLILYIVVPFTIAQTLRYIILHHGGLHKLEGLKSPLTTLSLLGLYLMVFTVFGLNSKLIVEKPHLIAVGAVIMNLYFLLRMSLLYYAGRLLGASRDERISLLYSAGSNMTVATAIALGTFGSLSVVGVALGGPFSDMILMILFAHLFRRKGTSGDVFEL